MMWIERIKADVVNLTNNIVEKVDEVSNKILIPFFICLIALVLILVALIICPSHFQKVMFRLTIAFGIAGLFSAITGSWKLKGQEYRGPITFGMFALVYLFSSITVKGNCSENSIQKGKVFLGKHPLEDATVSLPQHDFQTLSNAKGEFLIEWNTKDRNSDSILIHVHSTNIDTALYWKTETKQLHVRLKDTLIPISNSIITNLISEKVEEFQRKMNGNYLKWRANTLINLQELLARYAPYKLSKSRYRNEFLFESLNQKITFRKNLIKAGIIEVKEVVAPYRMHEFDSCSIFLLEARDFPNYRLDYLMTNSRPIEFRINGLQHIADNNYRVSISYSENIRDIRVNLNCSKQTNNYKIRQIEVYGFLPTEEYELKFRHGKWSII